MQDQQDWMDPNRPIRNPDDSDAGELSEDAMDNVVYRKGGDAGKKGGEAGRQGFNWSDANDDPDESDMDASDELMNDDPITSDEDHE